MDKNKPFVRRIKESTRRIANCIVSRLNYYMVRESLGRTYMSIEKTSNCFKITYEVRFRELTPRGKTKLESKLDYYINKILTLEEDE